MIWGRMQVNTRTNNVSPVRWCIYASPSLSEFTRHGELQRFDQFKVYQYISNYTQDIPGKIIVWFITRGQYWPSGIVVACLCVCVCLSVCLSVCQSLACPRDKPWPVQARITKFGSDVLKTLVKILIVMWSKSLKSRFTPFWACPHHNWSPVQARTTKFGAEVQNILVQISLVLGGLTLKSQNFWFYHYKKYVTTTQPPESLEYLDCFMGQGPISLTTFPS